MTPRATLYPRRLKAAEGGVLKAERAESLRSRRADK
jgi:hypothetical protein